MDRKEFYRLTHPLSKISGYATGLSRHSIAAGACAAGLLLSARQAGDIGRQRPVPGTKQQRRRSTALSSKCGQCRVDSRVDEAEHRLITSPAERSIATSVSVCLSGGIFPEPHVQTLPDFRRL